MKTILFTICCCLFFTISGFSQTSFVFDIQKEMKKKNLNIINREVTLIKEKLYPGIHLDERYEDGIVWLKNFEFTTGTIEFDTRGKDLKQHSFVGIAFHGTDTTTFETIYLRPFNFMETEDPKKSRMVQYVSKPAHTWQVLRGKFPGKYENTIEHAPAADSWVHVKVTITDTIISTYINNNSSPSLVVETLGTYKTGSVGFYVADTSGGDFANLKITKVD
jgi:hypothetical protein